MDICGTPLTLIWALCEDKLVGGEGGAGSCRCWLLYFAMACCNSAAGSCSSTKSQLDLVVNSGHGKGADGACED